MDVQGAAKAGSSSLNNTTVIFRTDASVDIGTGHVMRCLALACALRQKGAHCRFICRVHNGNLFDQIRQQGFEIHVLPIAPVAAAGNHGFGENVLPHAAWLGADWDVDAAQTLAALGNAVVDWLIVDHYALDVRWEQQLRSVCRNLMVIDDLADRGHDCDLLLDQNLNRHAADYTGRVPRSCNVLAGPKYALLRPEFAALRDYSYARRAIPVLNRLLVGMGGIDKDNVTGRILNALRDCALPPACRITVVMGAQAPWVREIRAKAAQMKATEVLVDIQDMAKLMADSDLAIGAAGTSAWERCCLGLPTLTVVLAENQAAGALALHEAGAALLLKDRNQLAMELGTQIKVLLESNGLQRMQVACRLVTDGMGVTRTVGIMANAN